MVATAPHYLLLTETGQFDDEAPASGRWRFSLRQIDGPDFLDVSDNEPEVRGARLQLLTVIRGLEAIDQPSRVTLVTSSQYIARGIRRDLDVWREMNWTWERFGELHPIKHADLWQRLDHALQFHTVQCRAWRLMAEPEGQSRSPNSGESTPAAATNRTMDRLGRYRRGILEGWVQLARKMGQRTTTESWVAAH